MEADEIARIADAVLYEGYLLYPYRASAIKNRQRWHFGVLYPQAFCTSEQANDASEMQVECLAEVTASAKLSVKSRFLHLSADVTTERDVVSGELTLAALAKASVAVPFSFGDLRGLVEIEACRVADSLVKIRVRIKNQSSFVGKGREDALLVSTISTHAILRIQDGTFISAIDPPDHLSDAAARCQNIGAWPVLAGNDGRRETLLAAPIILYDYPKIAPQSSGSFFDGTEIDEMLSLRVLTLTDDEKRQVRQDDGRAREILERTERLGEEALRNLHGAFSNSSTGAPKTGGRVRLHPKGRADVFDLVLAGKTARIESIEIDAENNFLLSVTVENDPGRDLGSEGKPGHRFFFRPDEVELL